MELPDSNVLITDRLILRRWVDSDAEDLYKYASDPDVGPICGWPPHHSIDESREAIKNVLSTKEAYAICLKENRKAIGAIVLKLNGQTDLTDRDDECEMGYWLGKPFWGQGIMPEAVGEMLRHAFEECGMQKVWIGYYDGNTKSKRVQEKSGFKYQWRSEDVDVPLMHEKRTGHVSLMMKEDWEAMQCNAMIEYRFAEKMEFDSMDKGKKRIYVVAAIIRKGDEVFASQRGYGSYKDWWEFPGGKIEKGETPEEALLREIREELAADIFIDGYLTTVEYNYPEFHLSMACYWCSLKEENLTLLEHEAARWLPLGHLRQVNWLPADVLVIEEIEKTLEVPEPLSCVGGGD